MEKPALRFVNSRIGPWLVDAVLAASLGLAVILLLETGFLGFPGSNIDTVSRGLLALAAASLVFRSYSPLIALAGVVTFGSAYLSGGAPVPPILPFAGVALFTFTANSDQPRAVSLAIALAVVVFLGLAVLTNREFRADFPWLNDAAWVTAAIFLGDATRSRHEFHQESERKREEEALLRLTQERLQIARELHDVVAHSISIINVQAGVAEFVLDKDPQQAKDAFAHIKRVSHETLQELRALVGVLREGRDAAPRAPVAGLEALEQLVDSTRSAGLEVDLEVKGAKARLPGTIDLAAYRILQEALTNAVRHAAGARVKVGLEFERDRLLIDVRNTQGEDEWPSNESGGHGLIGMQERVSALGGSVKAGPEPDGGFHVRAVLPIPEVVA